MVVATNHSDNGANFFSFNPASVGPNNGLFWHPPPGLPNFSAAGDYSGEFYGNSIGTSLSLLTGQSIVLHMTVSLFINGIHNNMDVTAAGFAVDYTSATPITDPQIPPPFTVLPGHGLAWALPFLASLQGGPSLSTPQSATPYFGTASIAPVQGTGPYTNAASDLLILLGRPLGGTGLDANWSSFSLPVPPTWLNPNNILLDDGSFTTNASAISGYLNVTGFNLAAPVTTAVNGLEVNIRGYSSDSTVTLAVQLIVGGIPTGEIKTIPMPTVLSTITLGSLTDLWANVLTPDVVSAGNFGIQITVSSAAAADTFLTSATITLGLTLLTEPQINLRWSDDGGYTWSNYYTVGMGNAGEYKKRVFWVRLGNSRQRVYEVSTGQFFVPLNMFNAYMELEAGDA